MTSSPSPVNKKAKLDDLESLSKEELIQKIEEQKDELFSMESKLKQKFSDETSHFKRVIAEGNKRENVLVNRLANKESEVAEIAAQLEEMKRSQTAGLQQLRTLSLDPAVALMLQQLSSQLDEANTQAKQVHAELQAWKFTPDSQTGKRLIARCRQLLTENEDLGVMISSGRTAQLEGDAALQKQLVADMRQGQNEFESVVSDIDDDVEALQSTVYKLQHDLRASRQQVHQLTSERQQLTDRLDQLTLESRSKTDHNAEHRTLDSCTDIEPQSTQQGVCSPPATADVDSPTQGSPAAACSSASPGTETCEQRKRHTNGIGVTAPASDSWTQADTSWGGRPTSSANEPISNGDIDMDSPGTAPSSTPMVLDAQRAKRRSDVEADSTGDALRTSV